MAASTENGVFVVTQYIPAANPSAAQSGPPKNDAPRFLQTFIKGQPKSLGIVQIMIGFICAMLWIMQYSARFPPISAIVWVPFMGAVLFVISGGLSVSAEKNGTRRLVKGSLAMNILSAILSAIGVILCSCDLNGDYRYYDYDDDQRCYGRCYEYKEAFYSYRNGVLVILLLFFLLEFCIAIATSCFGCKSLQTPTSQEIAQPLFTAQNNYTQDPRVLAMQATGVPMAHRVALREDIPMAFGVTAISGLPQAQVGIEQIPTAPPSYYKDVPGDTQQLQQHY